jgi:hypothetical protein
MPDEWLDAIEQARLEVIASSGGLDKEASDFFVTWWWSFETD